MTWRRKEPGHQQLWHYVLINELIIDNVLLKGFHKGVHLTPVLECMKQALKLMSTGINIVYIPNSSSVLQNDFTYPCYHFILLLFGSSYIDAPFSNQTKSQIHQSDQQQPYHARNNEKSDSPTRC